MYVHFQVGTKGNDVPEDTRVGKCFAVLGVMPFDTRDEAGRERFHLFRPGYMLVSRAQPSDWLKTRSIGFKEGDDCCAPDSVSFHYVKQPEQMRAYDAFLHDECRPGTLKNGAPFVEIVTRRGHRRAAAAMHRPYVAPLTPSTLPRSTGGRQDIL
jgi:hypothetical protein